MTREERLEVLARDLYELVNEASDKLSIKRPQDFEPKLEFVDPLDVAELAPGLIRQLLTLVDYMRRGSPYSTAKPPTSFMSSGETLPFSKEKL